MEEKKFCIVVHIYVGFPGGTSGKELACQCRRHETWVWSMAWADPLEEGMETYSSTSVWRIPWTEEPGEFQSMGVAQSWAWLKRLSTHICPELLVVSESRSVVSGSLQPHGLYSPLNPPGQNTEVGSLSLLQGIFTTQGWSPGLLYCRQILYQLSHKGSPRILEWVAYPLSRGSFQPRNWIGVSCIAGGLFTNWALREAHAYTYTHIYSVSSDIKRHIWRSISYFK